VQTKVIALDVGGGEAANAQYGIGHDQPVLESIVEADHEGDERVVDRLSCALAGLYRLGLCGDERADVVDRERPKALVGERGEEALATMDLIVGPGAVLKVGAAADEPTLPVGAEGLGGVDDLAALHLLGEPPAGVRRGTPAGEPAFGCLAAIAAAEDEAPTRPFARGEGVDA
jgi:hypothetical protein